MTISTTTSTIAYTGNGSTTAFAVPYVFFGSAELEVIERVIATGVETTRVLTTDYTVTGGNGATGTVTALVAPASTVTWTIRRTTPATQLSALPANGPFPSATVERGLDRVTAIAQETQREAQRGVLVPKSEAGIVLPSSVTRAGLWLGFDGNGLPIAAAAPTASGLVVTPYGATLVRAATAAVARTTLGATVTGGALFTAADAPAARTTLGVTTVGSAVFTATDAAAARVAIGAGVAQPVSVISGSATLVVGDLGKVVIYTGAGGHTVTLMAASTAVDGDGVRIVHRGSGVLTVARAGSDTLNGGPSLVMAPDETATIQRQAAATWAAWGLGTGFVRLARTTTAASQTVIDFALPAGFDAFTLDLRGIAAVSGTPSLFLRFSTNAGVSFLTGGSDYYWGALDIDTGPASRAASFSGSEIQLWSSMQNTLSLGHNGVISIAGSNDSALVTAVTAHLGFARAGVVNSPTLVGGATQVGGVHNAVRLVISTSVAFQNGGVVTLMGRR